MQNIMKGSPPTDINQVNLSNWRTIPYNKWAFSNVRNIIPTANIPKSNKAFSLPENTQNLSDLKTQYNKKSMSLNDFLLETNTDSFSVLHKGDLIYNFFSEYANINKPHIIFSISKSMTALLAGCLVKEKLLQINKNVSDYVPEVKNSAYSNATVRNLLDMNVASGFVEDYLDKTGLFNDYRIATGWNTSNDLIKQGLWSFLPKIPQSSNNHGEKFHYCSPHTDMLGWVIERATGEKFSDLFSSLILNPCGAENDAYITVDFFGAPRTAGGINICINDLIKIAEMFRCKGSLENKQIVSEEWINDIISFDNKKAWIKQDDARLFLDGNYRSFWYQTGFSENEICAIGIHGQWIWINPIREIVIIKYSSGELPLNTKIDNQLLNTFIEISREVSNKNN